MLKQTLKGAAKTLTHPLRCLWDTLEHCLCTDTTIPYTWEVRIRRFNSPVTAENTRQECIDYLSERANLIDPLELAMGYPAIYLVRNGFRIHRLTADEIAQILRFMGNK
jgi:hypothetical protein